MDFAEYQEKSKRTDLKGNVTDGRLGYYALGLADETGEVASKVKKLFRDYEGKMSEEYKREIVKELGDVMWYVAQISTYLGVTMDDVAQTNIDKLASRLERNALHGKGDNR
jgi:NTP pyrophosphatase (non-canonical NTP hydrolase)